MQNLVFAGLLAFAGSAFAVIWPGPADFKGELGQGVSMTVPTTTGTTVTAWVKFRGWGKGDKPYPRVLETPGFFLHAIAGQGSEEEEGLSVGVHLGEGSLALWSEGQAMARNGWTHLAVTMNPSGGKMSPGIYINGVFTGERPWQDVPSFLEGGPVRIGNSPGAGDRPFDGGIASVEILPRLLTDAEIVERARVAPDGCAPRAIVRQSRGDRLRVVDLTGKADRQVVIAAGTEKVYQGHPTTLLADDGRTMFCAWTLNHGGPCGPFARSEDGGRTWKRIDDTLPVEYKKHHNCPTLQKIKGPDGKTRYFVFSAYKGLGILVSEDLGRSWRVAPSAEHLSAGMPPTGLMHLKDGTVALFGQVFKCKDKAKDRPTDDQAVWMSVSKDGGFTWDPDRIVAQKEDKNLCEPCCLRSPDGLTLCLLMRENRHRGMSMMCFSKDEGKTWSEPVDTCWGLTGDRHEAVYVPGDVCGDGVGRYVVAFRDRAIGASTYGQFVAWVGTWDDIVHAAPGTCRIHLLEHYTVPGINWSGDTGYSGVELLPNGDIACTTYSKEHPDSCKSSVVSMRFKMSEILQKCK